MEQDTATFESAELSQNHNLQPPPFGYLWLELTEKCNLSCQHCYVSSSPDLPLHGRMTKADWLSAIRESSLLGCKSIQFIGGEPLLYPHLDELISYAKDCSFESIEVYSNGTPITADRARHFSTNDVRVACSFYSSDESVHDAITGKAGSFRQTVAALERLANVGADVRVGFIEMELNRGHFEEAVALLHSLGVAKIRRDSVRGFGRGTVTTVHVKRPEYRFDGLCGQCSQGRLCITNSGAIYPCPMSRSFEVGNYLDEGLTDVVHGSRLSTFQRGMIDELRRRVSNVQLCSPNADKEDVPPCSPGPVPCMICSPGNCNPDFKCAPDVPCPICLPGLCIPS